MSNRYYRELIVFGYARQNYHKAIVSADVLSLCLLLYGLDGFSFTLNSVELRDLIVKQNKFQQNVYVQYNEHPCINSPIFNTHHIKYQIKINANLNSTLNTNWGDWGASTTAFCFNVNVIDPLFPSKRIAQIIFLITMYCKQTNMETKYVINTDFNLLSKTQFTRSIYNAFIGEQLLNKHQTFSIYGCLDVLHIEIIEPIYHQLKIYHPHIKMSKYVQYKWKLNNKMVPYNYSNDIYHYYSPSFDNNNWCLLFEDCLTTCSLTLQLMQLPYNVSEIQAISKCELIINDKHYSNATIASASFKKCSSWGYFNNTDDDNDKNNINTKKIKKEFKMYSNQSVAAIGSWNKHKILDNNNNDNIDLDTILLIIDIEIVKVYKETHITKEPTYTFSWNNNYDMDILEQSEFNSYGIIDAKKCFDNMSKNVSVYNGLWLQKEIKNVGIKNQTQPRLVLPNNNNNDNYNDNREPTKTLFIDETLSNTDITDDDKDDDNAIQNAFYANNVSSWNNNIDNQTGGNVAMWDLDYPDFLGDQSNTNAVAVSLGNNQNNNNNYNMYNDKKENVNWNDSKNNEYKIFESSLKKIIKNEMKQLFDNQQQKNKNNYDYNRNLSDNSDDIQIDNVEYKINEKTSREVEQWLDGMGLEIYSKIFILNGFDSLDMVKEIKTKKDLKYIGVKLKAHQIKLLNHINTLRTYGYI